MNTMCATLKSYSAESHKVASQTDRDMEKLRQQLLAVEEDRNTRKTEILSLTEKLQSLEEQLRSKVTEVVAKEEELQSMQEEMRSKDKELAELLKAVECIQSKVRSPLIPCLQLTSLAPFAAKLCGASHSTAVRTLPPVSFLKTWYDHNNVSLHCL